MVNKYFVICLILFTFCSVVQAQDKSLQELENKAFTHYKNGAYREAIEITENALKLVNQMHGSNSIEASKILGDLGVLYGKVNDQEKANQFLSEARAIREKHGWKGGLPLGLESEELFTGLLKQKELSAGESGEDKASRVMILCDINGDQKCTDDDIIAFQEFIGSCEEDLMTDRYDIDDDGCITEKDQDLIFK